MLARYHPITACLVAILALALLPCRALADHPPVGALWAVLVIILAFALFVLVGLAQDRVEVDRSDAALRRAAAAVRDDLRHGRRRSRLEHLQLDERV